MSVYSADSDAGQIAWHTAAWKQEAQLSLGWGRPYWLSLTLKVIESRWFSFYLKGPLSI